MHRQTHVHPVHPSRIKECPGCDSLILATHLCCLECYTDLEGDLRSRLAAERSGYHPWLTLPSVPQALEGLRLRKVRLLRALATGAA